MKKGITWLVMVLVMAMVYSVGLMGQEQTELSIQVKKDGKVVKDTTYRFQDDKEARHVLEMVEVMSGLDAEMTGIKELQGNSLVWISEGEETPGEHMQGDTVVIMKKGKGETFDIWVDEDGDEDGEKRVRVVVSDDHKGQWTAVSSDEAEMDDNKEVYFFSEDDDGEQVKVIVIKKENDEEAMHHVDAGHDKEVKVKVNKKKVKVENE